MASWQERAELTSDVAYFRYIQPGTEKAADEVYVWDLDKTYLDTAIDGFFKLLSVAAERAFLKKNVPGTNTLLQALAKNWNEVRGNSRFPLYFITASPPQMEVRIAEKFGIDNIRPFGCFYKDNLQNLTPKRLWRLKKQVGYKIQALMQLRIHLKENVRQVLWGDDSESDATIYNLYSDICSRRISVNEIREILKKLSVTNEQIDTIITLQSQVPEQDPVEKIYINLATDTDPDYYLKFGRRTLATYNTFQVACDLFQDGRLQLEGLYSVAQDMIFNYGFTTDELARSFDDLIKRRVLGETASQKLVTFLMERGLLHSSFVPSIAAGKEVQVVDGKVFELEGHSEPWIPPRVDYLNDYR